MRWPCTVVQFGDLTACRRRGKKPCRAWWSKRGVDRRTFKCYRLAFPPRPSFTTSNFDLPFPASAAFSRLPPLVHFFGLATALFPAKPSFTARSSSGRISSHLQTLFFCVAPSIVPPRLAQKSCGTPPDSSHASPRPRLLVAMAPTIEELDATVRAFFEGRGEQVIPTTT